MNLKVLKPPENFLKISDPITISFNPLQRVIRFRSKEFLYKQENITKSNYRILIGLNKYPYVIQLELLSWKENLETDKEPENQNVKSQFEN